MLWGKFAQEKQTLIDATKHLLLKAAHPSPLSAYAGFFGCRHFSRANEYLMKNGIDPVNWAL
jgi:uracil-DNA glycosylase